MYRLMARLEISVVFAETKVPERCSCVDNDVTLPFCQWCGESNNEVNIEWQSKFPDCPIEVWWDEFAKWKGPVLNEREDECTWQNLTEQVQRLVREVQQTVGFDVQIPIYIECLRKCSCAMGPSFVVGTPLPSEFHVTRSESLCHCPKNQPERRYCGQCGQSNRRPRCEYQADPRVRFDAGNGRIRSVDGWPVTYIATSESSDKCPVVMVGEVENLDTIDFEELERRVLKFQERWKGPVMCYTVSDLCMCD